MLKTIKTTKQLRLDELIKYVWDNALYPSHFENDEGFRIYFDSIAGIKLVNDYVHTDATLFTVEIEEEITENTKFDTLVSTYPPLGYSDESFVDVYTNQTINGVISDDKTVGVETERIYALIDNKLELIWERE